MRLASVSSEFFEKDAGEVQRKFYISGDLNTECEDAEELCEMCGLFAGMATDKIQGA